MARPQIREGEMASNIEGNFEYIEKAVADNRREVVLLLGFRARI
jgi:hypothetical protein